VVPVAPGKHRRPEAEPLPARTAGFFQPPASAASSEAGAADRWGPGPSGTGAPQAGDGFGSPRVNRRPSQAYPDWPPDPGEVPWPRWDGPPPELHPDHPSAPVPRVRAPGPPGPAGPGRGLGGNAARRAPGVAGSSPLPQRRPGTRPHPGNTGPQPRVNPQGYAPGYNSGRGTQATFPGEAYEPGPRLQPGPGYNSGQHPRSQISPPAQGQSLPPFQPSRGYSPAQYYGPGPDYSPARAYNTAYALAQGYAPDPGYAPAEGYQGDRGNRRLYAVPDEARVVGLGQHPGGGQTPLRDGTSSWPTGQRPAGQVLTVAEDQAAAITREASEEAAAIRQAAEQEAATIRRQVSIQAAAIQQEAADQAAAIRQAAEREAAELKAALVAMSGELGRAAAYVTQNLAAPGAAPAALPAGPATRPARPNAEPASPDTKPVRPGSRPAGPAARPARPDARPTTKPVGRQAKVYRKFVAAFAVVSLIGVATGTAELALHGFAFYIFRANGAGATETGPTEDQGPGQPGAPGAHHQPATHHQPRTAKPKP
jgi:hypothetical protein